jgi:hypothetical protein
MQLLGNEGICCTAHTCMYAYIMGDMHMHTVIRDICKYTLSSSHSSPYMHAHTHTQAHTTTTLQTHTYTSTHTSNAFHASTETKLFFYLPYSQLYTAVLMKGRVLSSYFGEEILEYSAAR